MSIEIRQNEMIIPTHNPQERAKETRQGKRKAGALFWFQQETALRHHPQDMMDNINIAFTSQVNFS